MCPLLAPDFQGFFFAMAINSTNEANKAGSTCLLAVYINRCIWTECILTDIIVWVILKFCQTDFKLKAKCDLSLV